MKSSSTKISKIQAPNKKINTKLTQSNWLKRIKDYFRKQFIFNVWDITLMGILLAVFLIVDAIVKYTFIGVFRISSELLFYILFGIIFGSVKGVFISLVGDTLTLFIRGRIYFWMWEFAIIPVFVALFSAVFYQLVKVKKGWILLVPTILLSMVIAGIVIIFVQQIQSAKRASFLNKITLELLLGLVITIIALIVIVSIILVTLYYVKKDVRYKRMFFVLSLVAVTLILIKWTWGPIVFIRYYNQFLAPLRNRPTRTLETHFVLILTPFVVKTIITFPLFTVILIPIVELVKVLSVRYYADQWKTSGTGTY